MQFKIDKKEFKKAVTSMKNVACSKSNSNYKNYVFLKVKGDILTVSASDVEKTILTKDIVEDHKDGQACVNYYSLINLINESDNNKIEITYLKFSELLFIDNGSIDTLSCQLDIKPFDGPARALDREPFLKLLEKTLVSVSKDETRYHLNGVLLNLTQHKLEAVSTDGHRLTHVEEKLHNVQDEYDANISCIVPTHGIKEIIKIIKRNKRIRFVVIAERGPDFIFAYGLDRIEVRVIEGEFPNWKQLIPAYHSSKLIIDRDRLLDILKKATTTDVKKSKSYNEHLTLKFNSHELKLRYLITDGESIMAKELIDTHESNLTYNGKPLTIHFDAKYLINAVKSFDKGEFEIFFGKKNQSLKIEQKGHTHVLIPVRG